MADNKFYFISRSGITIPKLIYGTAWKKERTAELVKTALEQGFLGVDTACQPKHYHEAGVGEGLRRAFSKGIQRYGCRKTTRVGHVARPSPDANASREMFFATAVTR